MRYVKSFRASLAPALGAALIAVGIALGGCSTGGPELHWMTQSEEALNLVATDPYLPVREQGDEGQWLSYEPRENPYTTQRGRIDKASVTQFIEARRAFKAREWERAETLLLELTETDDRLSGPWVLLGDIAAEKGEHQQALDAYVRAISINGDNVNAYLRLALTQRKLGRYLHAQNTYAAALKLWPDYPEAHLNLAVLYDIYLNHPLRAQKHMEAYQFLAEDESERVAAWLEEIRSRTGIAPLYENGAEDPETVSLRADDGQPVSN